MIPHSRFRTSLLAAAAVLSLFLAYDIYIYPRFVDLHVQVSGGMTELDNTLDQDPKSFIDAVTRDVANRIPRGSSARANYATLSYTCRFEACEFIGGVIGMEVTPTFHLPLFGTRLTQLEYMVDYETGQASAGIMWDYVTSIPVPEVASTFSVHCFECLLDLAIRESGAFFSRYSDTRLDMNWGAAHDWRWQVRLCSNSECSPVDIEFDDPE